MKKKKPCPEANGGRAKHRGVFHIYGSCTCTNERVHINVHMCVYKYVSANSVPFQTSSHSIRTINAEKRQSWCETVNFREREISTFAKRKYRWGPGKGHSNSHGARPVHLIITMIKWIRTSRLSIKNSLSLYRWGCRRGRLWQRRAIRPWAPCAQWATRVSLGLEFRVLRDQFAPKNP